MDKVKKKPIDPEKAAEEKKQAATESKLLKSKPDQLSEEALEAALAAAKTKLEEAGYGEQSQAVVDRLKGEVQTRQESEGKEAEAEHLAKTQVADTMVKEGKADTIKKAAENRAKAHKEKAESSPEAKRANVAKQGAAPGSAAANTLAKLPPAEKAKIKARAKIRENAEKAAAKDKEAPADEKADPEVDEKKTVKLSNGVTFTMDLSNVIDLANMPKGQLAFRYKHGWILINPMVPSRGKMGGGIARKFGVKSGTTTKGYFTNKDTGKGKQFVPTSTGHASIGQQIKDTKNKLNFQIAQKKEDAALKEEVKQVKLETVVADYSNKRNKAKEATVAALKEDDKLKASELHVKAFEAHSAAQTAAANAAELAPAGHKFNEHTTHHSDMALLHQKRAVAVKKEHEAEVQAEKDKAENEYMQAAAKAGEASTKMLSVIQDPDMTWDAKGDAHLSTAVAHQKAADLAKAAGKDELAEQHQIAVSVQKTKATENYKVAKAAKAQKEAKAKQAAMVAQAKADAEKAKKEAKAATALPKFQKVEAGVSINGEKQAVSGYAAPKGKVFVHKSVVADEKGYSVTSVSTGEKMPGEFKTQKEAKAAAHWAEENFPGKSFTKSGFEDIQKKNPEAWETFKNGWVDKEWQKPEAEFKPGGFIPASKTHEQKMAEAKEAGTAAGKEAYGSLAADKPKVSEMGEVTDPKKLAVLDAIDSLPESEYDKAPPGAWKKYFTSMYQIEADVDAGIPVSSETLKIGTDAHQVLVKSGVSDVALQDANKILHEKVKIAPKPEAKVVEKTAEDFKIELPGPGMYADGNAIKGAVAKMQGMVDKGAPDSEIQALHAAIQAAKTDFKTKHGVEYTSGKVEAQTAPKPFVPQLGDGGFFDAAKELGYHHPDFSEDVTEGWKVPAGTSGALKAYTGSAYTSINAQLRKYGKTGGSNDTTIAAMDKAFAAAPGLSKDMVTVRRLKDDGPFPPSPPPMEPGAEAIDYGYGSTSKSTTAWSGSVVMEVRMPKGTKVVDVNHNNVVSASTGEQEILLDRGAKYRVISDSSEGYQRNIVVEVVSTGHVKGES